MKYILDCATVGNINDLNRYLFHLYSQQKKIEKCNILTLEDRSELSEDGYKYVKRKKDHIGFDDGEYIVKYKDVDVRIKITYLDYYTTEHSYNRNYKLEINMPMELWENFNHDSCNFVDYHLHLKNGIPIKILNYSHWEKLKDIKKRSFDSIFIPKKLRNKIIGELDDLMDTNMIKKRDLLSIPHKKVFLLHGAPGTGKTSIAKAIASYLNWGILQIPINEKIDSTNLIIGVNRLPEKYIVLFEDIDSYFLDRSIDGKHSICFSDILNILDGINSPKDFVVVLTTNHVKKLDEALTRPGRIDCMCHITYIKKKESKDMFTIFFPKFIDKFEEFWKTVKNKHILTGCKLHSYFSYCYKSNNFLDEIDCLNTDVKTSLSMYI